MKIKKDDTILIIKGKDKGKKSKVLRTYPKEYKILAENINIKKKRKRGRKEGEKGQTVEISAPFFASKAKIICPKCGKLTRIGYKIKSGKESGREKTRVCKKCEKEI